MAIILKALMGMGAKLLTEQLIEELVVWGMDLLAKSTKTKVDDELAEMVKKHLGK